MFATFFSTYRLPRTCKKTGHDNRKLRCFTILNKLALKIESIEPWLYHKMQ